MSKVRAEAAREVGAAADQVFAVLVDYGRRPALLPPAYSDYRVEEGGTGAGTVASWRLQATRRRVREVRVHVSEPAPGQTLREDDERSSLVNEWRVEPAGQGRCKVTLATSWDGAGGIGGFFERTFAPLGLRRLHAETLDRLAGTVEQPTGS